MTPEQVVACVDFRYLTDALTPDDALAILRGTRRAAGREFTTLQPRLPRLYTAAGWLGTPDDKLRRLCRGSLRRGWTHVKIKVGRAPRRRHRRCAIVREIILVTTA